MARGRSVGDAGLPGGMEYIQVKSSVTRTGIPLEFERFRINDQEMANYTGGSARNCGPLVWPGRRAGLRERDRKSIKGLSYQRSREIHGAI